MEIVNAKLAPTIKRVAKNVDDIVKRKNKVKESIQALEEKYKKMYEEKVQKLQTELASLERQQELFEAPIRELTGGLGTEDLVTMEVVETGVGKNGKPTYSRRPVLKYPDTIVPPIEETALNTNEITPEEITHMEVEYTEGTDAVDELPFGNE